MMSQSSKMNTVGYPYIKVGRISLSIAKKCHIKAADVVVDYNHIRHITKEHSKELDGLAISALDYVKMVVGNFTEIRRNKGSSILLVKVNQDRSDDTVTVELILNVKKHQWEVRTAQPRRDLRGNELLYQHKTKASPNRKSLC